MKLFWHLTVNVFILRDKRMIRKIKTEVTNSFLSFYLGSAISFSFQGFEGAWKREDL
jgi:hypothetical protein